MAEDKADESTTEDQGSADGADAIERRTKRLIDQGCAPDLAQMAATVGEMYLTCFLAAKDVLEDKRIVETIGYTDVKYKLQAAETLMSKINVAFQPHADLVRAAGVPVIDNIRGLPPGHPLGRGRTG